MAGSVRRIVGAPKPDPQATLMQEQALAQQQQAVTDQAAANATREAATARAEASTRRARNLAGRSLLIFAGDELGVGPNARPLQRTMGG
jgi:hypothetical protein